jgi:hypothetical protein
LGQDKTVFGFDSHRNAIIDPFVHFEMMSYCNYPGTPQENDNWISDFTYEAIHNSIQSRFGATGTSLVTTSVSTATDDSAFMLIRGTVNVNSEEIEFDPFGEIVSPVAPPALPEGDYTLRLLDGSGNILDEIFFQPIEMHATVSDSEPPPVPPETGLFIIPVSVTSFPDLEQVQVLKSEVILGSMAASNNAPTVEVTFPNGGETLSGYTVNITWTARDRDRDTLTYVVQFSPDGGISWETLIVDHPQTSLEVNLNLLPQTSKGLIRVKASDGFLTGSDTSDGPFSVPNSPPTLSILMPFANQVFGGDQTIILKANSNDVEDGSLADAGYSWKSDKDGVLGTGKELILPATDLSTDDHTITLTGTDSGGATATDTVRIIVVGEEFPDMVITETKADKEILGPPDHKMVSVNVEASAVALPQFGEPTCSIVSVSSNELVIGKGAGKTHPDWEITGPLSVDLRAERSGTGTGREYTIMVECSATDGVTTSTATASVVVRVPHDM